MKGNQQRKEKSRRCGLKTRASTRFLSLGLTLQSPIRRKTFTRKFSFHFTIDNKNKTTISWRWTQTQWNKTFKTFDHGCCQNWKDFTIENFDSARRFSNTCSRIPATAATSNKYSNTGYIGTTSSLRLEKSKLIYWRGRSFVESLNDLKMCHPTIIEICDTRHKLICL